jgi:hypothetical protein
LGMALAVSFNCQSLFSKVLKFLTLNAWKTSSQTKTWNYSNLFEI